MAIFFDIKASSLKVTSLSWVLPFISSICSYKFSIVWYSFKSLIAPFSPIPLTPGILSELSPIKAFKSIILIGSTPYSSLKVFSLKRINPVCLRSLTSVSKFISWSKSLSDEIIVASKSASLAHILTKVPIISSAS